MRGKVTEVEDENGYKRITPAYAGKRKDRVIENASTTDHPRLCGEKFPLVTSIAIVIGITPAYAGKSH